MKSKYGRYLSYARYRHIRADESDVKDQSQSEEQGAGESDGGGKPKESEERSSVVAEAKVDEPCLFEFIDYTRPSRASIADPNAATHMCFKDVPNDNCLIEMCKSSGKHGEDCENFKKLIT
tara:strand:+ start:149 stop:511 length:363 start_codon:yes stop_codon:yes gene_type:complete